MSFVLIGLVAAVCASVATPLHNKLSHCYWNEWSEYLVGGLTYFVPGVIGGIIGSNIGHSLTNSSTVFAILGVIAGMICVPFIIVILEIVLGS